MTRRGKWKKLVDEVVADYGLNIDPITQDDINRETSNRLRALDARASGDARVRYANTDEEFARLIVTVVMMTRLQKETGAKWEMDHMEAWANGGTNNIENLAPCPSAINKMKEDRDYSRDEVNAIVADFGNLAKLKLLIPFDYVYETAWEWVLRNFG